MAGVLNLYCTLGSKKSFVVNEKLTSYRLSAILFLNGLLAIKNNCINGSDVPVNAIFTGSHAFTSL